MTKQSRRFSFATLLVALAATALVPSVSRAQTNPWTVPDPSHALFSCGDLTVSDGLIDSTGVNGTASTHRGDIASNGNIKLTNGTIDGNATPGPGKTFTKTGGTITGTTTSATASVPCTPIDLTALATTLKTANNNSQVPKSTANKDPLSGSTHTDFSLSGGDKVTLPAGTYYFTKFSLSGGSTVAITGNVNILVDGAVAISGGVAGNSAYQLRLWSTTTNFSFSSGTFLGFVYAPSGTFSLSSGTFKGTVFAKAVSISGGSSHVSHIIDDAQPTVAITSPANGAPVADPAHVTVTGTASDGQGPVTVTVNGQAATVAADGTFSVVINVGTASPATITAIATDGGGNTAQASVSVTTTPATPQPTVALTSPAPGSLVATTTVDLSGTVTNATSVTVNGIPATINAGVWTLPQFSLGPDGVHTLTIVATGPGGQATIKPSIENDTLAPSITITSPQPNACLNNANIAVTGTVSDPHLSTVTAAVGTGAPVSATVNNGTFSVTLPVASEGKFVFTITATDTRGHAATALGNVTIDRTKPAISVTSSGVPFVAGAYKQPLSLFVRVTDADPSATLTTALNLNAYVSGTPITADGSYTLTASATDCAGNVSDPLSIAFTIDTVAPKITIAPLSGTVVGAATNITGTTDGATTVALDGLGVKATVNGTTFTFTNVPLVEGTNNFTIVATDAAGNQSRTPYSLTLDSKKPVISITDGGSPIVSGTVFRQNVTPVITTNENAIVTATLNGQSFPMGTMLTADGAYKLDATATDGVGNIGQATASFSIAKNGPSVQITSPAGGATINSATAAVKVTVTGSNVANVHVNGVLATLGGDGSYAASVPLDPGPNVLTAIATDANGNAGTASISVVRDDGKLAILLIAPANGTYVNHPTITVAGQLLSAGAGGTVTINGATVTADAGGAFHKSDFVVTEGDNTITATVRAPNGTTNSVTEVIHGDFTLPVVHVTADGAELADGSSFATSPTINVTASDANQPAVAITLDGATATVPITGLAAGGHAITVVVTDAANNQTRIARSFAIGSTAAASGACTFGDTFDPPSLSAVFEESVKISGRSSAPNVLVNGAPASVAGGSFTATVALQLGRNDISIQCADASQKATSDSPKTLTLYRYTNATITITSPNEGDVLTTGKVTVSGTVDAGVVSGDVNGIPFTVPNDGAASHTFSVPNVGLANGLNILTARAVTSSSRVVMTSRRVKFLAATPQITITSPLPGTQTGAGTVDVTGNYTNLDPSTIQLTAGSATLVPLPPVRQSDTTGTFRVTGVPLTAGTTTITVTGRNYAGTQATSSVDVTKLAGGLFITIESPADGTTYGSGAAAPANITGSVSDLPGALAQVNGVPAPIDASHRYSAAINFSGTSGITPVIARVSTPDGQTATASIRVVKLAKPFAVSDSFPANNATGVDPGAMIVVLFTNPLDGSTLTGALTLRDASNATVDGDTFIDKDSLSFAPKAPLTPGTTYTFTVGQSLHDIAGGALASPLSLAFSVSTSAPDRAPSVDQSDAAGCITSTSITGHASNAGARLRLDVDSVSMTTTAAADKSFKFTFSLSGQSGYHIARVREVGADGSLSPDTPVTYRVDCAGPTVAAASLDRTAKKLTIQFSSPMNAATLTASPTGTIQLAPAGGSAVTGTVTLDSTGQVATVTTTADLSTGTFTLVVKKEAQDATGVTLAGDYVTTFSPTTQTPTTSGQGYVTGAVYDATTGRPLKGVEVDVTAPVNAFGKRATTSAARLQPVSFSASNLPTDEHGRYTYPLDEGAYTIQASAPGYTTVWRQVVVPAGVGVVPIDIRLTRRSAEQTFAGNAITLASGGDTAVTEPAELALTSASLTSGKKIALTSTGAQSLAGLLPLGWSPLGSAEVEIDGSSIPAPLTAKLTFTLTSDQVTALNASAQTLALAQYDSDRDEWRTVNPVTTIDANRRATFDITSSGNYALVYPDKQAARVTAPQPASSGAALQGVPNPCSTSSTACGLTRRNFVLNPSQVAPNGRTVATLTVNGDSTTVFPSGTAVQAYIDEQLNFSDGRVLIDPPFATDLLVYRSLAGDTAVAQFHLAPTAAAADTTTVTLRDGVDHIRVVDYPGRIDRGALIGSEGGRVPGDGTISIDIPTGATSESVHASVTPMLPSDLAAFAAIPGFHIAGGFTFSLDRASAVTTDDGSPVAPIALLKPARATFLVAGTPSQVIVAEVLSTTSFGNVVRLASLATPTTGGIFTTKSLDPAQLPVDGIVRGGRYLILTADAPIAFTFGEVRAGSTSGVAMSDVLVTTPSLGVADVTRGGGVFALPVAAKPAALFSLVATSTSTGSGAPVAGPKNPDANELVPFGVLALVAQAPELTSFTARPVSGSAFSSTSGALVQATFGAALDSSAGAGAITVINTTSEAALAGNLTVSGNAVTFTSTDPLVPGATYTATLSGNIRGVNGALFGRDVITQFTVPAVPSDDTVVRPQRIHITIPQNGHSTISGAAGAVIAHANVIAIRRGNFFIQQYQATAGDDGSFQFTAGGDGTDGISTSDTIDLQVIHPISHSIVAIVPLTPFVTSNFNGFLAMPDATTTFTSANGVTAVVPAGAFDVPTVVTLAKTDATPFADVPSMTAQWTNGASIQINFDGVSKKRIDVRAAAPQGADPNASYYLALHGNSTRGPRVMIVDTVRLDGSTFTTEPAASGSSARHASILASSPTVKDLFPGVLLGGNYAVVNPTQALSWVSMNIDQSDDVFVDTMPSTYVSANYIRMMNGHVLMPVLAGTSFTVSGDDVGTYSTNFSKSYPAQNANDPLVAVNLPSPIDAAVGPYPVFATPSRVEIFDLATPTFTDDSRQGLSVSFNAGKVTIANGMVPFASGTAIEILNLTTGIDIDIDSSQLPQTLDASVGDRIVVLIEAANVATDSPLTVVFSEPIKVDDLQSLFQLSVRVPGTGSYTLLPDELNIDAQSGNRRFKITLPAPLHLDREYQLTLSPTITSATSGLALVQPKGKTGGHTLYLRFRTLTPAGSLATFDLKRGTARDVALHGNILFVAAQNGGLLAYDASNPAALGTTPPFAWAPDGVGAAAGDTWSVATDHHGRVWTTALNDLYGLIRSYRVEDFIAASTATSHAVDQRGVDVVSYRPGYSFVPGAGTEPISGIPEATPRKMQVLVSDETADLGPIGALKPAPTAIDGTDLVKASIKVVYGNTNYYVQRITIQNPALGASWSVDVNKDNPQGTITVVGHPTDRLTKLVNTTTYGVVSLFGYGIGVYDLNAIDSNHVAPANAKAADRVLLTTGADSTKIAPCDPVQSALTGHTCPIQNLTYSPEATITTSSSSFRVYALDMHNGVLDVQVTPPSGTKPATSSRGVGLTLTSRFFANPSAFDHPRLNTLRQIYQSKSGRTPMPLYSSVARFTRADPPAAGSNTVTYTTYALVAARDYGLLVLKLDGSSLTLNALVDVVWTPAGAYSVRAEEGSTFATVKDGAGRILLIDLTKIDESDQVGALPTCKDATCAADLFPTALDSLQGTPAAAGEVGSDDPRILWKSKPPAAGEAVSTLAPVFDPQTGMLYDGNIGSEKMNVMSVQPPTLKVIQDLGNPGGPQPVDKVVPLGITPAADTLKCDPFVLPTCNASAAVFRILVNLPGSMSASLPGGQFHVAVESEIVPGATSIQTPKGFPRAHLRQSTRAGTPDPRASTFAMQRAIPDSSDADVQRLRYEKAYNQFVSPWVIAVADPRASIRYLDPGNQKGADGCASCTRPPYLAQAGEPTAFEIFTAGRTLALRAEDLGSTVYGKIAPGLQARIETYMADVVRSPKVAVAAQNPPAASGVLDTTTFVHSGELELGALDLDAGGANGWNVTLDRTYRSRGIGFSPLGLGWDASVFARMRELPNNKVEYRDGADVWTFDVPPTDAADIICTRPKGLFLHLMKRSLGWELLDQSGRSKWFDTLGRLIAESDQFADPDKIFSGNVPDNGNTVRYFYDASGHLATILDSMDRATQLSYWNENDASAGSYPGLLREVIDYRGRTVDYAYDSAGRLTKVTLPEMLKSDALTDSAYEHAGTNRPAVRYGYASSTLADGSTASQDYNDYLDFANNLLSVTDPAYVDGNPRVTFTFGQADQERDKLKKQMWPCGNATPTCQPTEANFAYQSGTTDLTDMLGQVRHFAFAGQLDGLTHITSIVEDKVPVLAVTPDAPTTSLVAADQPMTTLFEYGSEGEGQVTLLTSPDGTKRETKYSPLSWVVDNYPFAKSILDGAGTTEVHTLINYDPQRKTGGLVLSAGRAYQNSHTGSIPADSFRDAQQASFNRHITSANDNFTSTLVKHDAFGNVTNVHQYTTNTSPSNDTELPAKESFHLAIAYNGKSKAAVERGRVSQVTRGVDSSEAENASISYGTAGTSLTSTVDDPIHRTKTVVVRDAHDNVIEVTVNDTGGTVLSHDVYGYDANGRLLIHQRQQKSVGTVNETFSYDRLGRVISSSTDQASVNGTPSTVTTTTAYDLAGHTVTTVHPPNAAGTSETDTTTFDPLGRTVTTDRAASNTPAIHRSFAYDIHGALAYSTSGVLTATLYRRDALGREIERQTADGSVARTSWTEWDQPSALTTFSPSGTLLTSSAASYTRMGEPLASGEWIKNGQTARVSSVATKITEASWLVTTTTGAATDATASSPATDRRAVELTRDVAGRTVQTRQLDPATSNNFLLSNVTSFVGDQPQLVTDTYPLRAGKAFNTFTDYDPLGHVKELDSANLRFHTTASSDEDGRPVSFTGAGLDSVTTDYDSRGLVTTEHLPGNVTKSNTYDAAGNLVSFVDETSSPATATNYTHDGLGRVTKIAYPDGTSEETIYEAASGRVSATRDRAGQWFSYVYDKAGRVTEVHDGQTTSGTPLLETFEYKDDRLFRVANANADCQYDDYDNVGRPQTTRTHVYANGSGLAPTPGARVVTDVHVQKHLWGTRDGERTRWRMPAAGEDVPTTETPNSPWRQWIDERYDAAGNVSALGFAADSAATASPFIISTTAGVGILASRTRTIAAGDFITKYTYDDVKATLPTSAGGNGTTPVDPTGLLSGVTTTHGTILLGGSNVYRKDSERLASATLPSLGNRTSAWKYDGGRGRLSASKIALPDDNAVPTTYELTPADFYKSRTTATLLGTDGKDAEPQPWHADEAQAHQIQDVDGTIFSFTGGRRSTDGAWKETYDAFGRVISFERVDGSRRVELLYDPNGRVVSRKALIQSSGGGWDPDNDTPRNDGLPSAVTFVWDPITDRLLSIVAAGTSVQTSTTAESGLIRQFVHGDRGYDDPVEVLVADGTGQPHHYLPIVDEAATGSVEAFVDGATGNLAERVLYADSYGAAPRYLHGAVVDDVKVGVTNNNAVIQQVLVTVHLSDKITPSTAASGLLIHSLNDDGTEAVAIATTPTLPDDFTMTATLTPAQWTTLHAGSILEVAITDSLRTDPWPTTPVLPPPTWAQKMYSASSVLPSRPWLVRASMTTLDTFAGGVTGTTPSYKQLYHIESLYSAADTTTTVRAGVGFHALPLIEPATGFVYARARWFDPTTGTFLSPDPLGYRDSSNLYALAGGDPVNGRDPAGEQNFRERTLRTEALRVDQLEKEGWRVLLGGDSHQWNKGGADIVAVKTNSTIIYNVNTGEVMLLDRQSETVLAFIDVKALSRERVSSATALVENFETGPSIADAREAILKSDLTDENKISLLRMLETGNFEKLVTTAGEESKVLGITKGLKAKGIGFLPRGIVGKGILALAVVGIATAENPGEALGETLDPLSIMGYGNAPDTQTEMRSLYQLPAWRAIAKEQVRRNRVIAEQQRLRAAKDAARAEQRRHEELLNNIWKGMGPK